MEKSRCRMYAPHACICAATIPLSVISMSIKIALALAIVWQMPSFDKHQSQALAESEVIDLDWKTDRKAFAQPFRKSHSRKYASIDRLYWFLGLV